MPSWVALQVSALLGAAAGDLLLQQCGKELYGSLPTVFTEWFQLYINAHGCVSQKWALQTA